MKVSQVIGGTFGLALLFMLAFRNSKPKSYKNTIYDALFEKLHDDLQTYNLRTPKARLQFNDLTIHVEPIKQVWCGGNTFEVVACLNDDPGEHTYTFMFSHGHNLTSIIVDSQACGEAEVLDSIVCKSYNVISMLTNLAGWTSRYIRSE